MAERALVLDKDPRRYLVLPHMQVAAWDALQMLNGASGCGLSAVVSPWSVKVITGIGATRC